MIHCLAAESDFNNLVESCRETLSSSRDNWERLVAAVVKREEIWQLCHQNSFTTISSHSSGEIISISRIGSKNNSESPQRRAQLASGSGIEVRNKKRWQKRFRHPKLVHVIGFCHTLEEQLLVFRLMVNGSVESWLRGKPERLPLIC
ncbi:uncharacterized protein LOC125207315 [Salvia hispanica]|uniref:uncharacterized protein LOC125207315 n=1 Tax=Salvia hispanica TaxID=49212 RepID=UPI002009798B|nr:uncharacterized protein LOC125207315 [Salvia hispanica]